MSRGRRRLQLNSDLHTTPLVPDRDAALTGLFSIIKAEKFRDPFLDALWRRQLSVAGLRVWFTQTALFVREFSRMISAIHSNCPFEDGRLLMAENLWEEHGCANPGRDHYSLIKRLCRSVGATDSEVDLARPLPETSCYIDHCFGVARNGSFVQAITSIGLGIEYFVPKFFGGLAAALRENYSLTGEDVEYLTVHVTEDRMHAERSLGLIAKYASSPDDLAEASQSLVQTLAVKRAFSEALYRAALGA